MIKTRRSTRPLFTFAFVVFFMLVAACGLSSESETQQDVVTTDLTTYVQGQDVVVTYTNMQGATTDWIALSRTTDGDDAVWAWAYTGGGTSGQITFTAPALAEGTYEGRAYYDWAGTSSYTVQQRSQPFTVSGNAMLSASASSFPLGQPVVISFSGFSGATTDWISIHQPGTADTNYIDWQYTGGGTNGSLTFSNLPSGTFEARYHANWDGTHSYASSATSSQFTIGGSPTVNTDRLTYGTGEVVTLSYANLPGNMLDYVAVSVAGSPASSTVQRFYTNGAVTGAQQFSGLAAGSYEARAYLNDTATILATSTFSITAASVTTNASAYTTGDTVTVTYSGMPGNAQDWIAIASAGSPDSQYVASVYTNGMVTGTAQFTGIPSGTYEARAYVNNTFSVIARSATFTVGGACNVSQSPVFESQSSGVLIIAADQYVATAPLTVVPDRSILFTSMRQREQSPRHGAVLCELHPADALLGIPAGITCKRNELGTDTSGSTGAVAIKWSVVTFTSGVSVQRGVARTYPTNPALVALTAIDPANSFVVLNGVFTNGTGWGNNEFTRARIVDAQTLEVAHNVIGGDVSWQVVSMLGASVQRGTTTLASAATTQSVPITEVPSGSVLLASYTSNNPSGIAASALMLDGSLQGANSLFFQRGTGGATLEVAWEVVSTPFATRQGSTSLAAGVTSRTESVPGTTAASSVAISSMQSILGQSGGWTNFSTTDLVGEAAATMTTGTDSIVIERASASGSAQIGWTVLDFARTCAE